MQVVLRVESVGDREALGTVWLDLLDRTEWLLAYTADPVIAATAQSLAHESAPLSAVPPLFPAPAPHPKPSPCPPVGPSRTVPLLLHYLTIIRPSLTIIQSLMISTAVSLWLAELSLRLPAPPLCVAPSLV